MFLLGEQPAAIDAQFYHVIWFLRGRWSEGPSFISEFTDLVRWEDNSTLGIKWFRDRLHISRKQTLSGRSAALLMKVEPQVGFVIYEAAQRTGAWMVSQDQMQKSSMPVNRTPQSMS